MLEVLGAQAVLLFFGAVALAWLKSFWLLGVVPYEVLLSVVHPCLMIHGFHGQESLAALILDDVHHGVELLIYGHHAADLRFFVRCALAFHPDVEFFGVTAYRDFACPMTFERSFAEDVYVVVVFVGAELALLEQVQLYKRYLF